jgi:UTP--glucose-1-phosphate uridylyltransferase
MIKKAIIPIGGLGTRFLPLSKIVPKEFLPLVDKPAIQYIIEEAKASGIKEIIFVIRPKSKEVLEYFEESPKLERFLKARKRTHLLRELQKIRELAKNISFSIITQKEPLGDGHAILQAKKIIKKDSFGVFFPDDIVDSQTPCLLQLADIFRTSQAPIIGLKEVADEDVPNYGIVGVEKISSHLYKIKKIIEKPEKEKAPSNLAIVGRYILTPEIFGYLEKTQTNVRKEIILAEALRKMLDSGKIIYGYEFEGKWLECGTKSSWLESSLYLGLKHPEFGEKLKKSLDKTKL